MITSTLQYLLAFGLTLSFNFGNPKPIQDNSIFLPDTTVGSKIITDEIAGSAYRKSAKGYFLIIGKDTSKFTCIFSDSKDGKYVSLDFIGKDNQTSYRERMEHLRIILPFASKDYKMDSLKSIYFGRLVNNGDIAIYLTKNYRMKFGKSDKISNYSTISRFIEKSKLCSDINLIFKPYSISVKKVMVEKVFFTSKKELNRTSKIETKPSEINDKILDCLTWISLKPL
ncbi:hypothetical protein I5907_16815 [Panacibacter sp. DH6]|uniref:Uncharacterized protein n=1 Tax=Panacibacter microcysteis TaxID=2793269 RepID=A0A931GYW9_9BACT|nr:hypothetical protein [Panacibacter microcysteis]MBG9377905.1 hypothetical protein [Panacibacter microcysteis]